MAGSLALLDCPASPSAASLRMVSLRPSHTLAPRHQRLATPKQDRWTLRAAQHRERGGERGGTEKGCPQQASSALAVHCTLSSTLFCDIPVEGSLSPEVSLASGPVSLEGRRKGEETHTPSDLVAPGPGVQTQCPRVTSRIYSFYTAYSSDHRVLGMWWLL